LYPYAHEIIVVEGGHEDTRAVTTSDGHSIDGTLEALRRFKREEDPDNKVKIITRDGHWPKLDELGRCRTVQSRAYADLATGDYLWQVDIDEFYRPCDMTAVLAMLRADPSITAVSFKARFFWGNPNYEVDSWMLRRGVNIIHRLFKWGQGYRYVTHEPPTVYDRAGHDLRELHWIKGEELARRNIYLYHYPQIFPWQVRQKALVYRDEKPDLCSEIVEWSEKSYFRLDRPYRVERHYWYPSWLQRFSGEYPPEVARMMDDIAEGRTVAELRPTSDVEVLLKSWWYPLGRLGLKVLDPIDRVWRWVKLQERGVYLAALKRWRLLLQWHQR